MTECRLFGPEEAVRFVITPSQIAPLFPITQARNVERVIDEILARPEHAWFQKGAAEATKQIREAMQERYGQRR